MSLRPPVLLTVTRLTRLPNVGVGWLRLFTFSLLFGGFRSPGMLCCEDCNKDGAPNGHVCECRRGHTVLQNNILHERRHRSSVEVNWPRHFWRWKVSISGRADLISCGLRYYQSRKPMGSDSSMRRMYFMTPDWFVLRYSNWSWTYPSLTYWRAVYGVYWRGAGIKRGGHQAVVKIPHRGI